MNSSFQTVGFYDKYLFDYVPMGPSTAPAYVVLPGAYVGQECQKIFIQHMLCPGNGQLT